MSNQHGTLDALCRVPHPLTPREKVKLKPSFGDVIENGWASDANPTRIGFFVREFTRTGRLNPGVTWEITDGKGKFWEFKPKDISEGGRLKVTRRTALASGSGDHAELARLADMADWMADGDPGANGSVLLSASVASEHAADLRAILAENAALRAERVHLVEQKEGAEDALFNALSRATEAERKLAEADRLLERIANDPTWDGPSSARLYFLSKEAERG